MALQLPDDIKVHIKGSNTNLFPLIEIGETPYAYISTNECIKNSILYKPLVLSVSSIKESIDLEQRNYKISSVSISISNAEYQGQRFSESITGSMINEQVKIYWTSEYIDEPFLVYIGKVQKYNMSVDRITLSLEDKSQELFSANIPKDENIPQRDSSFTNIREQDLNKRFPITYGYVKSSPLISPGYDSEDRFVLMGDTDDRTELDLTGTAFVFKNNSGLYKEADDSLWSVYITGNPSDPFITSEVNLGYRDGRQIQNEISSSGEVSDTSKITFSPTRIIHNNFESIAENPMSDNLICIGHYDSNYKLKYLFTELDNYNDLLGDNDISFEFNAVNDNDYVTVETVEQFLTSKEYRIKFEFEELTDIASRNTPNTAELAYVKYSMTYSYDAYKEDSISSSSIPNINTKIAILVSDAPNQDTISSHDNNWYNYDIYDSKKIDEISLDGTVSVSSDGEKEISWSSDIFDLNEFSNSPNTQTIRLLETSDTSYGSTSVSFRVAKLSRVVYYLQTGFKNGKYFAHTKGRLYTSVNPLFHEIVQDIISNELLPQASNPIDVNIDNFYTGSNYDNIRYAFTIDEKINSKRLLEEIAGSSPYILRFDYKGTFKFDTIKPSYDQNDIDHTILE